MEKSCKPPYPFKQMQPAPMPPIGMAIWVLLSPRNSRCGPRLKRSARENEDGVGVFAVGVPAGAGTAAPTAAEEVVRRKSRRDGFSSGMAMRTGEVYHRAVWSDLSAQFAMNMQCLGNSQRSEFHKRKNLEGPAHFESKRVFVHHLAADSARLQKTDLGAFGHGRARTRSRGSALGCKLFRDNLGTDPKSSGSLILRKPLPADVHRVQL